MSVCEVETSRVRAVAPEKKQWVMALRSCILSAHYGCAAYVTINIDRLRKKSDWIL